MGACDWIADCSRSRPDARHTALALCLHIPAVTNHPSNSVVIESMPLMTHVGPNHTCRLHVAVGSLAPGPSSCLICWAPGKYCGARRSARHRRTEVRLPGTLTHLPGAMLMTDLGGMAAKAALMVVNTSPGPTFTACGHGLGHTHS